MAAATKASKSIIRQYTDRHCTFPLIPIFMSIFRSLKNRFVPQHVRFIQTTAQLLEVVKVPPFADSVSEGDVR